MTAAFVSKTSRAAARLRPVDPRRDMTQVAEVIEGAFADELGADGRRMVREMRAFGRMGWFGWLVGKLFLPPAADPRGFVWEESGRLVGNASLLAVVGHSDRWVLANVAVQPEFQNRGVATALVGATIDLARKLGGRELVLQVKWENAAAIHLYDKMGFRKLCTRTTWLRRRHTPIPVPTSDGSVRRRRPEEWRDQLDLAWRLHPEGLEWPYPLRAGQFQPGPFESLLGLDRRHWVWVEEGELLASLSIESGWGGSRRRFVLVTDPRVRGRAETPLLVHALHDFPDSGVVIDYPAGEAGEGLSELGFEPMRTLTWMGRGLWRRP